MATSASCAARRAPQPQCSRGTHCLWAAAAGAKPQSRTLVQGHLSQAGLLVCVLSLELAKQGMAAAPRRMSVEVLAFDCACVNMTPSLRYPGVWLNY